LSERLVLNLHGIGEAPAGVPAAELRYWCSVPCFEALLDTVRPIAAGSKLPIEITFDDGNLSDATIALPALAARGLRATFFVCAGRIGRPGYLDAAALRELLGAGMIVGSHGWAHRDWRRCDDATLQHETQGALDALAEVTGRRIESVGVPFGSYDRRVLAQLRRCGVRLVYTSDGGLASTSAWLVPRHSWTDGWSEGTLRDIAMRTDGVWLQARRRAVRTLKRWR
jgi:peptidoglycan/xylan/chitin deacetylase (PgdA/CDA1 family)